MFYVQQYNVYTTLKKKQKYTRYYTKQQSYANEGAYLVGVCRFLVDRLSKGDRLEANVNIILFEN